MKVKIGSNRSFGIVFFILFLVVALWPILNNGDIRIWSLIISIIFLVLGILNSKLLNPLNILWFKLGMFLGKIISPIIMLLVFFVVVTPISLFLKIFIHVFSVNIPTEAAGAAGRGGRLGRPAGRAAGRHLNCPQALPRHFLQEN